MTKEQASADRVVESLLAAYERDPRAHRIGRRYLPSREETLDLLRDLLEVLFPGYWGRPRVERQELRRHVAFRVASLRSRLSLQIELALLHREELDAEPGETTPWTELAARMAEAFLDSLAELRGMLVEDVQAAFDGDPAAKSIDEVVLAYPGVLAVAVYRIANKLHVLGVPLLPRVMTEWAHAQTGADLHPGATIGRRFFIDHATGAVIGETAVIGARVKLYQGVTLGAHSRPADPSRRTDRRHPTVEDDVTIYANATVLGGDTRIGAGSVIAAGSFVTESIPPGSVVGTAPRAPVG